MRTAILAGLLLAAAGLAASAGAQIFPVRPVTLIVPFPAGGPSDTVARIVGQAMSQPLGEPVTVENIVGDAGTRAAARLAQAAPDGYTVGMATWSTQVVSPVVYHPSYNVFKDFAPVALLTETPLLIVANKRIPANNLHELIAWLKANPDTASQGGAGGTDQLIGYMFQKLTGTRMQYLPYPGLAAAMADLIAGRIDLLFDQPSDVLAHIRSGAVKVFAVTAKHRLSVAPEIPTVDEAGLPGLYLAPFQSMWAPRGTPAPQIARLNAAVVAALSDPQARQRLADLAEEIVPRDRQTPSALALDYMGEINTWWPIIRAAGIRAN